MTTPKIWMPIYWGDYLRDTMHLTTAEHGAYLLLIGHYWTSRRALPDDDARLAAITRMPVDAWSIARAVLADFFTVADGVWRHERVEEELTSWTEKKSKQTQKAKAAAEARWAAKGNAQSNATSMPQAMHEQCPSPSPSPVKDSSLRSESPPKAKAIRGSRMHADAVLTDEWRQFAVDEGCLDPDRVWAKFKDHWIAKTGANATKADWFATWRNWVRGDIDRDQRTRGKQKPAGQPTGFALGIVANLAEGSRGTDRGQWPADVPGGRVAELPFRVDAAEDDPVGAG